IRLGNAVVAYGWYLGKTFWPANLAAFYPHPPLDWSSPAVLVPLLLLAGITGAALLLVFRPAVASRFSFLGLPPAFPVGWLWFLGMLVPVIGFVQVGKQAWADRYTYLPHIGLFIAMVWGLSFHASRITLHVSRITHHVSRFAALALLAPLA